MGAEKVQKMNCLLRSQTRVAEKQFLLLTQCYLYIRFSSLKLKCQQTSHTNRAGAKRINKESREKFASILFDGISNKVVCAGQFDIVLFIVRERWAQLSCYTITGEANNRAQRSCGMATNYVRKWMLLVSVLWNHNALIVNSSIFSGWHPLRNCLAIRSLYTLTNDDNWDIALRSRLDFVQYVRQIVSI